MKLITIGITTLEGDTECIMSDNTALGKAAARSHSSLVRSILFDMIIDQPLLYLLKKDGVISYSLIQAERIYTICTDTEIYPYTPANMDYLHGIFKQIIEAHNKNDINLISKLITEGVSHYPNISPLPTQPAIRIHRLSFDRIHRLEDDISTLKNETIKLSMSATFFAPKTRPVKKSSSILSGLRWFFGFFSFCGSCLNEPSLTPTPNKDYFDRYDNTRRTS